MKKIWIAFYFLFAFVNFCDARVIFLHIPRTAGTTLDSLISQHYKKNEIYPFFKIAEGKINTYSLEVASDVLNAFPMISEEYVHGQFPVWFLQKKDLDYDKSFIFTVLRDPVDRVLSHWSHLEGKGSPIEICPNIMCKMLSSDVTLEGEDLLQNAILNLKRMDFIFFQDNFDYGVNKLFSILGFHLDVANIPKKHVSQRKEVSLEVIEEIKKENALDIRLYMYAKKKLKDKFYK